MLLTAACITENLVLSIHFKTHEEGNNNNSDTLFLSWGCRMRYVRFLIPKTEELIEKEKYFVQQQGWLAYCFKGNLCAQFHKNMEKNISNTNSYNMHYPNNYYSRKGGEKKTDIH